MCSCSVTALGDILFVNTSNGVDNSHVLIPIIVFTIKKRTSTFIIIIPSHVRFKTNSQIIEQHGFFLPPGCVPVSVQQW